MTLFNKSSILFILNIVINLNISFSMQISTNPFTTEINGKVPNNSAIEIEQILENAETEKKSWKSLGFEKRSAFLTNLSDLLLENKQSLAKLITMENGCPVSQTYSEVDKSISIIKYFVENGQKMVADEIVAENETVKNYIKYDPIGLILHISPYNYPLYLALRPLIPGLLAGNTVILKTPSNTPLLGMEIKQLIEKAGFPTGVFSVLFVPGSDLEPVIADERVNLITLIGSEKAGSSVATIAGKHIKKTILELGGNDPFIVFEDVIIDAVVENAIVSRLRNAGQSCNAAKRFLVHEKIAPLFIEKLKEKLLEKTIADPMDEKTDLGPLATEKSLETAIRQIQKSIEMGALNVLGCHVAADKGFTLMPSILTSVTVDMPVFKDEVFAPIFPISTFKTVQEAINLANTSIYGLGASVWSANPSIVSQCINSLETGNVAINSIVRGDPKMPYGGVKKSGYGREFSTIGMRELVNIKSIMIKK